MAEEGQTTTMSERDDDSDGPGQTTNTNGIANMDLCPPDCSCKPGSICSECHSHLEFDITPLPISPAGCNLDVLDIEL